MKWGWVALGAAGLVGVGVALSSSSSSSKGKPGPDPKPGPEPKPPTPQPPPPPGPEPEDPEPPDDPTDDHPAQEDDPLTGAKFVGAPFAEGDPDPVWPIDASSTHKRRLEVAYRDVNGKLHGNGSRRFKASRGSGSRYHAGIDLYANPGDVVLAPEDGQLVAAQNFLNTIAGKDALLVQGNAGVTFLLGEIVADSWKEFGHDIGSYVWKGQPIARIAQTSKGSHMLHIETYKWGTKKNAKWNQGQPAPPNLLDPSAYLLRALARARNVA